MLCQLLGSTPAIFATNLLSAQCPAARACSSACGPMRARPSRAARCSPTRNLPITGRPSRWKQRRRTARPSFAAHLSRRDKQTSCGITSAFSGRTAARAATGRPAFARGTRSSRGSSRSTTTRTKRPSGSAAASPIRSSPTASTARKSERSQDLSGHARCTSSGTSCRNTARTNRVRSLAATFSAATLRASRKSSTISPPSA